jgi:hypothetical protein
MPLLLLSFAYTSSANFNTFIGLSLLSREHLPILLSHTRTQKHQLLTGLDSLKRHTSFSRSPLFHSPPLSDPKERGWPFAGVAMFIFPS